MKLRLLFACITALATLSINAANWMERLPDDLYVAQVSIPGAHDSATGNGFTSSLTAMFAQCQDISVAEQWKRGVRAFDFRPIVKKDHLHINHGIAETNLRFDDALHLLRDSLIANPSEFAIIHMLYANNYDSDKSTYVTMLTELLQSEDLKPYLINYTPALTVGDMRGKILILSRDEYALKPISGGFFRSWCGDINWGAQTSASIIGPGSGSIGKLYVQDFANTTTDNGGVQKKVDAVNQMLEASTKIVVTKPEDIVWVFNFASSYPGTISTADGYRENATYTHAAIIDYFKTHDPGPTGVVLMDYTAVDRSPNENSGKYVTRGQEAVDTIIANNFKWLKARNQKVYDKAIYWVDFLYKKHAEFTNLIARDCPDVAADFADELAEILALIDEMKAELDYLRDNFKLTDSYVVEYNSKYQKLRAVYNEAKKAQADFEASAIETVIADEKNGICQIYSINGQRLNELQKGTVNIVRYNNGVTKKIAY